MQGKESIVVIGQNYWGEGDDLAEAKANFQKQGGRLSQGYRIMTFGGRTEFQSVDNFGRVTYLRETFDDEPEVVSVPGRLR